MPGGGGGDSDAAAVDIVKVLLKARLLAVPAVAAAETIEPST